SRSHTLRIPSLPTEAARHPSAETARSDTSLGCASRTPTQCPVLTFQTRMLPSFPAERAKAPLGVSRTVLATSGTSSKTRRHVPEARSQSRSVWSSYSPLERANRRSVLRHTEPVQWVWPRSTQRDSRLRRSQIRTRPSPPVVAPISPCGEIQAEVTVEKIGG